MGAKRVKVCQDLNFLAVFYSVQIQSIFRILKCLKEIIKPYVKKQRELLKCSVDQKALVIMDVFTGQMTTAVLDAFKEADICIVNVPANMTKYYQPLDLTVNGYAKRYLKRKFIQWYSGQVF